MKPAWLVIGAAAASIAGCALEVGAPAFDPPALVAQASAGSMIGPMVIGTSLGQPKRRGKHWLYHILDALILSSPLTGIIAIAMFLDEEVRNRPAGLLTYKEDDEEEGLKLWPGVRRRILTKLGILIFTGSTCFLGLLTLLMHLLDLIPRIR